jgi:murein DD-endopeptidase MepM/ murein hydrolase activator NlpD
MPRLTLPLTLSLTLSVGACTRPVLYYPTPESAPTPSLPPEPHQTAIPTLATAAIVSTSSSGTDYLRERQIIVPVANAPLNKIENTFDDPRDGGRVHRAVDILAPRGTPILSADDGYVLRLSTSALGGICLYAADAEGRLVYYYAHMDHYHESMADGRRLAKGDTIGFVGTTGNAPKDVPHLHFQVMRMPADGHYWNGEPINPYDVLVASDRSTLGHGAHVQRAGSPPS